MIFKYRMAVKMESDDQLIKSIAALDDVTEYSIINEYDHYAWIDEASYPDELKEWVIDKDRCA